MILLCIDTTKQKAVIALNNNGIKSVHEIPESKKTQRSTAYGTRRVFVQK